MPRAYGKLMTLDLVLTIWGVKMLVQGTVELLDVARDRVS